MEKACQLIVKRGEQGRGEAERSDSFDLRAKPRAASREREREKGRKIFGRHAVVVARAHTRLSGTRSTWPAISVAVTRWHPLVLYRNEDPTDTDLRATETFDSTQFSSTHLRSSFLLVDNRSIGKKYPLLFHWEEIESLEEESL